MLAGGIPGGAPTVIVVEAGCPNTTPPVGKGYYALLRNTKTNKAHTPNNLSLHRLEKYLALVSVQVFLFIMCIIFASFLQYADIYIDLSNSKRMTTNTQYSTCLYYFALHFCIYYMWTLITFNSKVQAST